mgnify:CR=1 FL=1
MFEKYNRVSSSYIRPVTQKDIDEFNRNKVIIVRHEGKTNMVSISKEDLNNGSPKLGDVIAHNPSNYLDQWLINEAYFKNNFIKSKNDE